MTRGASQFFGWHPFYRAESDEPIETEAFTGSTESGATGVGAWENK